MVHKFIARLTAAIAAAMLVLGAAASAETKVGSTVESRVMLGFKVNDAAAQAWLPEGWTLVTLPGGPVAGSNLLVSFIDKHLIADAEGAPNEEPANRAVSLLSFGRKDGVEGVRTFVTRVYENPPIENAYSNGGGAAISRDIQVTGDSRNRNTRIDTWTVVPRIGGEITLSLTHTIGNQIWTPDREARPYSAAQPDFFRIYRYHQMTEVVMNSAMGRALDGEIAFSSTVPELAPMFDGTQELTAILSIPVYVREVFLP